MLYFFVNYKNGEIHKLDGPAHRNVNYCGTKVDYYYVNGKEIPDELPKIFRGQSWNGVPINRKTVMDAMLFDREYGRYLKGLLDDSNQG